MTFYQARHSFATLICLSNGVPIETISKMMGHHSIRTTQIYAEITNHKVSRDLAVLSENTKGKYSCPMTVCRHGYSNAGITADGKRACIKR